jgi:Lar family restriction alleviation protein
MSIDTPLPCPFCGAEAEMRTSHVPDEWAARIQCTDCGTEKFGRDYFEEAKAKANALASWNRRAPVPALASTQDEILRLKAEVQRCHERLEIDHEYVMSGNDDDDLMRVEIPFAERAGQIDGIEARDCTIAILEEQLEKRRAARSLSQDGPVAPPSIDGED